MAKHSQRNSISPRRRRRHRQRKPQQRSSRSTTPPACPYERSIISAKGAVDEPDVVRSPRPYMKQVKLHPSGCQQWSSQIVTAGGLYMAYASTLTTYVFDVRDFSLVALLGGNECNVHSLLWHPHHGHRLLVFNIDGNGSEWDVRSEERQLDYLVGAPPACSAWDPSDESNLAVVSRGTNTVYLLRKENLCGGKRRDFSQGYRRRRRTESPVVAGVRFLAASPDESIPCIERGNVKDRKCYTGWEPLLVRVKKSLPRPRTVLQDTLSHLDAFRLGRTSDDSLSATCAKWSQHRRDVVVVGWTDGRVSLTEAFTSAGEGKTKLVSPCADAGSVVDIRHDPNGGAYVLVAFCSGCVILWDTSVHSPVASFDRCAVGLIGVRWMAWAPGNFMALSSKTAVARVFTVSQKHSIRTVRLGGTDSGIRDVAWLLSPQLPVAATNYLSPGPRAICGFRDGSLSVVDAAFGERGAATVRGVFGEGGSGAIPWTSKAGHIETVFGCAHSPRDADTLATCSYGSNVKIWHVPTMDLKVTLAGQTGAIYSVAWSTDGDRIASSSGQGTVWIWDAECGKVEQRFHMHSRAVHRVQWDPHNKDRLASAGADRSLVVFNDRGTVERVLVHPGPLFGCHWCPDHVDVIVTGCQDGNVRVFDLSWKAGVEPQYILSGHSKRVFHVCWSPLLRGTLASGSDDCSVMIWSLSAGALPRSTPAGARHQVNPIAVLKGHTGYVRPLFWNSEIPWLLLSGSWDGTVRAWDIRRGRPERVDHAVSGGGGSATPLHADQAGACIAVMSDHVADVYGLSAGLERPFLYVSVSRDTTIRQFTIEGLVSSIKTRAVVGGTLSGGLGNIRDAMHRGASTALCGGASKSLEAQLRGSRRREVVTSMDALRRIFNFWGGSDGMDTFWEALRWVAAASIGFSKDVGAEAMKSSTVRQCSGTGSDHFGQDKTKAGSATPSLRDLPQGLMMVEERVIHRNARRAFHQVLAGRLVNSPTFIVQDRRLSRSDRLERAARQYLAIGDIQSACEALVRLGKWERALALAPGVGTDYWRELADRFVEALLAGRNQNTQGDVGEVGCGPNGNDVIALATALLISTGRPMEAAGILNGSDEAFALTVSVADGAYPLPAPSRTSSSQHSETAAAGAQSPRDYGPLIAVDNTWDRAVNVSHSVAAKAFEAKLLVSLDQDSQGIAAAGRESAVGSSGFSGAPEKKWEEKNNVFPECERANGHQPQVDGSAAAASYDSRNDPLHLDVDYKYEITPLVEHPSDYEIAGTCKRQTRHEAAQRHRAEVSLRSMTQSRANAYFRASQPLLAAASVLSVCDGSRASAAPAMAYLLQGDEPELAFAAAKVLRMPRRELRPLVCEMARRAEAWGDPDLAVELLMDAGEDGDGAASEQTAYDDLNEGTTAEAGCWPLELYGTGGMKAGPKGAAQVALRYRGALRSILRTDSSCRSAASYLEDAGSATRRGLSVEAVRLLALGGDIAQASTRGVTFLRQALSVPSLPPGSLKPMLVITRALGSGPSFAHQFPQLLRAEILAYSSYIGALEAVARGYRPVVVPLLRNASVCVKLATKLRGARHPGASAAVEGKHDSVMDGNRSPESCDEDASGGQRLPTSEVFPPCMSPAALAAAAIHWLTTDPADGRGCGIVPLGNSDAGQAGDSAGSRMGRNPGKLFPDEAKAVDHLLACSELAARREDMVERRSSTPTTGPEAKRDETANRDWRGDCSERRGGGWTGAWGEIIVGGSRLPSCRRHERTAWGMAHTRHKAACHTPLLASGLGQLMWPAERGAMFPLEDGFTFIGLSHAVMWAKVNPFSPLNTGERIMPF